MTLSRRGFVEGLLASAAAVEPLVVLTAPVPAEVVISVNGGSGGCVLDVGYGRCPFVLAVPGWVKRDLRRVIFAL